MQCNRCKNLAGLYYEQPGDPPECEHISGQCLEGNIESEELFKMLQDMAFALAQLEVCPWYKPRRRS